MPPTGWVWYQSPAVKRPVSAFVMGLAKDPASAQLVERWLGKLIINLHNTAPISPTRSPPLGIVLESTGA